MAKDLKNFNYHGERYYTSHSPNADNTIYIASSMPPCDTSLMDNHWKTRLLELKHELESLHAGSSSARDAVELDQSRVGRLSRMDALQGQAMNNAIAARRKQKLIAIDTALQRLDEGEYGYCLKCGDDIPHKRLEQDPTAAVCLPCSR